MTFPSKINPKQKLRGYLRQSFHLIEHEMSLGIPMSVIHAQINQEGCFTHGYDYFSHQLNLVRKEVRATQAAAGMNPVAQRPLLIPEPTPVKSKMPGTEELEGLSMSKRGEKIADKYVSALPSNHLLQSLQDKKS